MKLHASQYGGTTARVIGTAEDNNSPIIILHGLFGSSRNWHPIAKVLSARHLVFSLDLRNHGKSPHSAVMDYPHMAQDVLEFIYQEFSNKKSIQKKQHPPIKPVTLIAHSMGGKAAMWLALSYPELVQKLVVVDIAPVSYEHDFDEVLRGLHAIPLAQIKSRQDADQYLSEYVVESSLRQFLLQNLQFKQGEYRWRVNLEIIMDAIPEITGFPKTTQLTPFAKRVLFIAGGQSDYLSKPRQELTRELFPKASFATIKSAGHWLHAEQPDLFMALVKPYLKR